MSQFDDCIDRTKTSSIKWSLAKHNYPESVLPLWVADMDFQTAPEIITALNKVVSEGVYGYSLLGDDYVDACVSWLNKRHQYIAQPEWLMTNYGVVMAIAIAIQALTKEGDSILIQTPVYHPFANTIRANHRNVVTNSLHLEDHRYTMDIADFEKKIVEHGIKLFILCNPHNPVGRVWSKDELQQIADICIKHHVVVVADEIHSDFIYEPYQHVVFSSLSKEIEQLTILCTSASKTFNLAGLQVSNTFIANDEIRQRYLKQFDTISFHNANSFGLEATKAAYLYGESWLEELLVYLKSNIDYLTDYFKQHLPLLPVIETQGTYLMWVDFRALNMSNKALNEFLLDDVGLWLNAGEIFGDEGQGFQRINIATQKKNIIEACQRLREKLIQGGYIVE